MAFATRTVRYGARFAQRTDMRVHWLAVLLVGSTIPYYVSAQQVDSDRSAAIAAASEASALPPPSMEADADRMFGLLPNHATVEGNRRVAPISAQVMFESTAKNTFDPVVFSFAALTTATGQGGAGSYGERYARTFADTTIGNFMTSAVMPSLLHQDPRYYQRGSGSIASRAMYAVSRTVITRDSGGSRAFNTSEMLGNLTASTLANAYYEPSRRSVETTLIRWATQVAWDALSNELKEFWPDVRRHVRGRQ